MIAIRLVDFVTDSAEKISTPKEGAVLEEIIKLQGLKGAIEKDRKLSSTTKMQHLQKVGGILEKQFAKLE